MNTQTHSQKLGKHKTQRRKHTPASKHGVLLDPTQHGIHKFKRLNAFWHSLQRCGAILGQRHVFRHSH